MTVDKIVCCIDFSENADSAFSAALEMAEKYDAKLYIVHVLPPIMNPLITETEWVLPEQPKKSLILKLEERLQEKYVSRVGDAIDYELIVLDGHVSSEILRFLEENDVDLAVMGSYGLSGAGLVLFGSVAKRVAHKAPCSVMIVRTRRKE